ncbi:MAG TPA: hypothetical protein VF254_10495 [Gammaproteobacteria bacterium]
MNACLLATGLFLLGPDAASPGLDALFLAQRQEVVQEIRNETRLDLHSRSARFFAPDGELHRQLAASAAADKRFAAR